MPCESCEIRRALLRVRLYRLLGYEPAKIVEVLNLLHKGRYFTSDGWLYRSSGKPGTSPQKLVNLVDAGE